MTSVNIETLSLVDLRKHRVAVDDLIKTKEVEDRKKAIEAARAAAEALGFKVEDLFGSRPTAPSVAKDDRQKVAAKYAHPENPELTWTGRGRTPKWIEEKEAKGHKREEFLISGTAK
jgi:DNA-binding protein H-NS